MNSAQTGADRSPITAAVLTPEGRGAVATIQVRGDERSLADSLAGLFAAANGRPLAAQEFGRIVFGRWGSGALEDVVICRVDPHTVDIHCHGGRAAPRRVLHDLERAGAAIVFAARMQEHAVGRFQAELLAAVSRARTLRTADILLEQANGLLERALRDLLAAVINESETATARFDALLRYAEFGRHLTEPWRVVVTGRPNVGKSSLINALAGFSRSIVFDQPGTTRDVVTAEAAFDGWPLELFDTAGIRESSETLEATGVERARSALESADCRVLLLDLSEPLTVDDHDLLRTVPGPIVVAHKCDLPAAWEPGDVAKDFGVETVRVSAKTNAGMEALEKQIVGRLVPEVPAPGQPIPVSPRQVEALTKARKAAIRNDTVTASRWLAELLD